MSLTEFLNNFGGESFLKADPTNIDRVLHGYNRYPPQHFFNQHAKQYHTHHHFPNIQIDEYQDASNGFGIKYAGETGYGHSGGGGSGYDYTPAQPVHPQHPPPVYHPPPKKHKLKGAALSAITLLAFLFFLNILQNCLKEQTDAMNPTVVVMTPVNRVSRKDTITLKYDADEPVEEDYQYPDEYKISIADANTNVNSQISHRTNKSYKQKSTIAPKLQNLLLRNSPIPMS